MELLNKWKCKNKPGASLAVSVNGTLKYAGGVGLSNLEYGIENTENTIFHVASLSKQFTAMAIYLLVEIGQLNLDEDIHTYIPELHSFNDKITTNHLIHHTSGLRDQWELAYLGGWRDDDLITQEQLLKLIMNQRDLSFIPGSRFAYCNSAYTLLAEIVARVSGKSFALFIKEEIFDKLGMEYTHVHFDNNHIVKNRAYSYKMLADKSIVKSILSFSCYGATSIFTNVLDFIKWGNHLISLKDTNPVLYENMTKPCILNDGTQCNYSGGLKSKNYLGYDTIEHNGWDAGFRASIVMIPELKVVSVCLSNYGIFKPELYAKHLIKQNINQNDIIIDNEFNIKDYCDKETIVNVDEMIGYYVSDPGYVFQVFKDNNDMFISIPRMPDMIINKLCFNTWWVRDTDMYFRWRKNNLGEFGFDIIYPYDVGFARKIDTTIVSETNLSEYEGDYYSLELEMIYHIRNNNDTLLVTHIKAENTILHLVNGIKDTFVSEKWGNFFSGEVQFERDNNSNVLGLTINTGRSYNIKFRKIGR